MLFMHLAVCHLHFNLKPLTFVFQFNAMYFQKLRQQQLSVKDSCMIIAERERERENTALISLTKFI